MKVEDAEELARIFRTLSVTARIRILELAKDRPLCVGALAAILGVTPGAVSQHLRVLRDVGLVMAERRGYFVHYRLNHQTLARWREALAEFWKVREPQEPCEWAEEGGEACARFKPDVRNQKS